MKRTTIYLEPELELLLKTEMLRRGKPMAELIREALRAYLGRGGSQAPPGAGAFRSGHRDTRLVVPSPVVPEVDHLLGSGSGRRRGSSSPKGSRTATTSSQTFPARGTPACAS